MPRTSNIHNPTLSFLHKFVVVTFFPRHDIRPIRIEEMKLLYAAVNHIRVSPAKSMADYWSKFAQRIGDIEITSWVTRLASNLGLLEHASLNFIQLPRGRLTLEHFMQGHYLSEDRETNELFMIYAGYVNEIKLPNPDLWLANVSSLTLPLETEAQRANRLAQENL